MKAPIAYHGVTISDLMAAGLLAPGQALTSVNGSWPATATITAEGQVTYSGATYPTSSTAAAAVKGGAANGWDFWAVDTADGSTRLSALRTRYQKLKAIVP